MRKPKKFLKEHSDPQNTKLIKSSIKVQPTGCFHNKSSLRVRQGFSDLLAET